MKRANAKRVSGADVPIVPNNDGNGDRSAAVRVRDSVQSEISDVYGVGSGIQERSDKRAGTPVQESTAANTAHAADPAAFRSLPGNTRKSTLTPEQEQYVFNCEVLGLPNKKAATLAGMPLHHMRLPEVLGARQELQRDIRGKVAVTKEDIVVGMQEAIYDAKILAEPMTQIVGLKTLHSMLGFDQPQTLTINHNVAIEGFQKELRLVPTSELVKALGADSVIDGDFYDVTERK